MRRIIVGFAAGLALLTALSGITAAAPSPSTTVVLSCEHGVGAAQATVRLMNSISEPVFDTVELSCGPDSTSGLKNDRIKVFTGSAGFFLYEISLTNALGSGGCVGGSVPDSLICVLGVGGPGVKLTVR